MKENKDIRKQEAGVRPIPKRQVEEAKQRQRMDGLLRLYQDARSMEKTEVTTLAVDIKNKVIRELSNMITIVEKDNWVGVHPHEAFPKIDIRMLICECPASSECPFLLAILRKIGMARADYVNYRKRAGMMVLMEYKRKLGKMK